MPEQGLPEPEKPKMKIGWEYVIVGIVTAAIGSFTTIVVSKTDKPKEIDCASKVIEMYQATQKQTQDKNITDQENIKLKTENEELKQSESKYNSDLKIKVVDKLKARYHGKK
jgi:cytochrome c-type biogenesis protein CcmH/NrfF